MHDLRQIFGVNSVNTVGDRLIEAGYEANVKIQLQRLWNILSRDILEQNTLFFNYQYSLFANEILGNFIIGHNTFKSPISAGNVGIMFGTLMAINASRRVGSTLLPPTKSHDLIAAEDFSWDAEFLANFETRTVHIIEKLRDASLIESKEMCEEITRGCNLFDIHLTSSEECTGLVRASLALGMYSFPDFCNNLPVVRRDLQRAWSNIFTLNMDNKEFASKLLDGFWLNLYPYISDGVILLDQVKADFVGQQLTYNLHNLSLLADNKKVS